MSKTAAERQRESRARKRDIETSENVTSVTKQSVTPIVYVTLAGEQVYGRQAVRYEGDMFDSRPEPLNSADTPDRRNRCIYERPDGSRYLIDATGNTHTRPDPPAPVSSLSDIDLQLRLKSYEGASWVNSPEHNMSLRMQGCILHLTWPVLGCGHSM